MEISLDVLLLAAYGRIPPARFVRLVHARLMEVCERSAFEWEAECARRGGDRTLPFAGLGPEPPALDPLPEDDDEIDLQAAEQPRRRRLAAFREAERRARQDLAILRELPPAARETRVAEVDSEFRFRSRALVALLIAELDLAEAPTPQAVAGWASLALAVLRQVPGAGGEPWYLTLAENVGAECARAMERTGDLSATSRAVAALDRFRRAVEAGRVAEPPVAELHERLRACAPGARAPGRAALSPSAQPKNR